MNWLRKFMIGRYGMDQFSTALLIAAIFFSILSRFFANDIFNIFNLLLLFAILYRTFSKDIGRRYQENGKFLKIWHPLGNKINNRIRRLKSFKNYRYYKCSSCKQKLRVPRGKGRIAITCPKCNMTMIKKS